MLDSSPHNRVCYDSSSERPGGRKVSFRVSPTSYFEEAFWCEARAFTTTGSGIGAEAIHVATLPNPLIDLGGVKRRFIMRAGGI